MDETFMLFLNDIPAESQAFVLELDQYLTEKGSKGTIKSAKSGFVTSYSAPKSKKAYCIKRSDVVNAIQLYKNGAISKDALVEWVNVVWFTELYVFDDEDADSIVSVLEVLETMDEDDVIISENELSEMKTALTSNTEYTPL